MSRRYTPAEKSAILAILRANYDDISLTHHQTGIPERTLREWRRSQLPPPKSSPRQQEFSPHTPDFIAAGGSPPGFTDDLEAMRFMRSRIMQELLNLTTSFNDDFGGATPYHRVQMLSRLLERLMKLDNHLKPYIRAEQIIRVVRVDKTPKHIALYEDDDSQPDSLPHPSTEESQDVEQS